MVSEQQSGHVFISYVREDKEIIDRLCREFDEHGVKYWLDRNDLELGARWKDAIRKAIRQGQFFLACFSSSYNSRAKSFMNEELTLAIEELRQYAFDRAWFIPVLLTKCEVPARSIGAGETLLDIHWVPLYKDWAAGIKRLLYAIKPVPRSIQELIIAIDSGDKEVRESAMNALSGFGPKAATAIPSVIAFFKAAPIDIETLYLAQGAISYIGNAAVPALIEIIKEKDVCDTARGFALSALEMIGPTASEAVPMWLETFRLNDNWTHFRVESILMKIGNAVIPFLIEVINDKNIHHEIRKAAIKVLSNFEAKASPAVLALIETLKDKDLVKEAISCIECIGTGARAAAPALKEILKEKDDDLRLAVMNALFNIGSVA